MLYIDIIQMSNKEYNPPQRHKLIVLCINNFFSIGNCTEYKSTHNYFNGAFTLVAFT